MWALAFHTDGLITVLYVIHVWWRKSRYGRERQECWPPQIYLKAAGLDVWSWRRFTRLHQIYCTVFPCSPPVPCGLNPTACNVCSFVACKCPSFSLFFCPAWLISWVSVQLSSFPFVYHMLRKASWSLRYRSICLFFKISVRELLYFIQCCCIVFVYSFLWFIPPGKHKSKASACSCLDAFQTFPYVDVSVYRCACALLSVCVDTTNVIDFNNGSHDRLHVKEAAPSDEPLENFGSGSFVTVLVRSHLCHPSGQLSSATKEIHCALPTQHQRPIVGKHSATFSSYRGRYSYHELVKHKNIQKNSKIRVNVGNLLGRWTDPQCSKLPVLAESANCTATWANWLMATLNCR